MKIIRTILFTGIALLCVPGVSSAQRWFGAATWNISIPDGDTKKFIDETSYRGFGMDFRKLINDKTTIGLTTSWEVLHQRTSESIEVESDNAGITITGSQDRYINSFPIMLGLHRYLGVEGGTRPYFGINAGGFWLIQTLRVGLAEWEDDTWEWGVMPEAGLIIPLQSGAALIANARYTLGLTGENLRGDDSTLSYWGIRVGFAWEQY